MSVDPLIQFVATGLTAIVFARAVVEKAGNYAIYAATLRDYRLLPDFLAPFAAGFLLAAECCVLAALLAPATRSFGALAAIALLGLYGVSMSLALRAGRTEIECGCGGAGQIVSWLLVARNLALMCVAGLIMAPRDARVLEWTDYAQGVCAIAIAWLLLAIAEKTIESQAAVRRLQTETFL